MGAHAFCAPLGSATGILSIALISYSARCSTKYIGKSFYFVVFC